MNDQNNRAQRLSEYLGDAIEHVEGHTYSPGGKREYLVFTDAEATAYAREMILDSVWAFRPAFLVAHGVPMEVSKALQPLREGANAPLLAVIKDVEHFVDDAIRTDGRGHFISFYDNEEIELKGSFFAYRVN